MDIITKINDWAKRFEKYPVMNSIKEFFWIYKNDIRSLDLAKWYPPKRYQLKEYITFSLGDESDVIEINKSIDLGAQSEEDSNIEMFHRGNIIVIGRFDKKIICYSWAVFKRKSILDKWFHLKPNESIIMRGFTHRDFRNKGVYACCKIYLLKCIKDLGLTKVMSEISTVNYASLKSSTNLGVSSTGSYYLHLHFLFWDFAFPFGPLKKRFYKKKA